MIIEVTIKPDLPILEVKGRSNACGNLGEWFTIQENVGSYSFNNPNEKRSYISEKIGTMMTVLVGKIQREYFKTDKVKEREIELLKALKEKYPNE